MFPHTALATDKDVLNVFGEVYHKEIDDWVKN